MQRIALFLIVWLSFSQYVSAEGLQDRMRFSGFGTIGFASSNEDDADYRSNIEQSTGTAASNEIDSGVDSIFGAQMDFRFNPALTATAQIIYRRLSTLDDTRPYFEWANIKYKPTESSFIRIGRTVNPTFMISESRMVGYAQPAVRTPADVYLLSPVSYINGIDAGYKFSLGQGLLDMRAAYGTVDQDITQVNGTLEFSFDVASVSAAYEYENSMFRIAYQQFDMDIGSPVLDLYDEAMNILKTGGVPNAEAIHADMSRFGVKTQFLSLGYLYDNGDLFTQAEFSSRTFDSDFAQSLNGYYFLIGYHIGDVSPYLSFSKLKAKNLPEFPELDTSSIGPELGGLVQAVNAGSEFNIERDTWTVGVRWDLMDKVAVKAQYDRIEKPANTNAEFVNTNDSFFAEKRSVDLMSVSLDYIF